MSKIRKTFKSVWRRCKIFILTILFLLTFPIIFILLSPIYTIRAIVNKLNGIFYPHRGKILSTKSAVFAVDKMYDKPRCPLLVMFVFDGHVKLKDVRERMREMISKKNEKTGEFVYPEMRQYLSKWLGFFFWRWCKDFVLEDHIQIYNGQYADLTVTEDSMRMIVNEITLKPFMRDKPLWEGIIMHNTRIKTYQNFYSKVPKDNNSGVGPNVHVYKLSRDGNQNQSTTNDNEFDAGEQTAIIFKLHHCLADGISTRVFLMDLVGYTMKNLLPPSPKISTKQRIFNCLAYPIRAPFETIAAIHDCKDVNEWHLKEHQLAGELRSATTEPLTVDFIKDVKNSLGVSFAAVILAAVSGGIRNFMIEQNAQIPSNMHCLTPLPMPGHKPKLYNHLTGAAIPLPLGKPTAAQRLKALTKCLNNLKNSVVPQTNYLFYPVIGGLFPFMIENIFKHNFTTAILSSFQGPEERIHFLGANIEEMAFAGGLLVGSMGVGISLLSYNGIFRILIGVDKQIISSYDEVKILVAKIHQEFFVLRDLEIV